MALRITGFSHVTINVRELSASLRFYIDLLGMALVHRGEHDVYLEWGDAWVCLLERDGLVAQQPVYGVDHVAFRIAEADFDEAMAQLRAANVPIVRGPEQRGLGRSIYFLDPDGTQLELHTSTLAERMIVWT